MKRRILYIFVITFFSLSSCQDSALFELERRNLLITGKATLIEDRVVLVSGELLDININNSRITEHGHCWSITNATPTIENNHTKLGLLEEAITFESQLSNLRPASRYFVRAYVQSEDGSVNYGNVVEFNTDKNFEISLNSIFEITKTSAKSRGILKAEGVNVIDYGHCWSSEPNPVIENNPNLTRFGSFTGTTNFTSNLNTLEPGKKYYIRTYMTIEDGFTFYSELSTFTTVFSDL